MWSRNGKELYYTAEDGQILAVEYSVSGDSFLPGQARPWSNTRAMPTGTFSNYDILPDGKRAVVVIASDDSAADKEKRQAVYVQNLFDEVRRRLPQ